MTSAASDPRRSKRAQERIRWWGFARALSAVAAGVGVFLLLVLLIRGADFPLWALFVGIGLTAVGGLLTGVTGLKRRDAVYADGYLSEGTVIRVDDVPAHGDYAAHWNVTVTAEVASGVRIDREFTTGKSPRIGQRVRFRHLSVEPGDLHDLKVIDLIDAADDDAEER